MEHQNMTTFSNVSDVFKSSLVETDEQCATHQINLVSAFGRKAICMECQKEEVERQNEELINKAVMKRSKRTTYDWLASRSILVDETLKTASFDSYQTNCDETVANKDKALRIAREYYAGATNNTILNGKPGVGKSHLAMSMLKIVNEYSEPYRRCLFVSIDELMRRIKDSFNNKESRYTEQRMIELLVGADLLVIDDLGAETGAISSDKTASDFTTRTLYSIINGRMNKPTIITTNLSSEEIAKKYDTKLVSRMFRGTTNSRITFKKTTDKRINSEF